MVLKKTLLTRIRTAVKKEGLIQPKKVNLYSKRNFKGTKDQYGETDVRTNRKGKITRVPYLYVNEYAPKLKRNLKREEVKKAFAHEISHLKYSGHNQYQRQFARKIYYNYLK